MDAVAVGAGCAEFYVFLITYGTWGVILFLDFDGVLHPEPPGSRLFCNLPRLEAVLRDHPSIEVVISSTWRERLGWNEILELFSADIRSCIIGYTPHHNEFSSQAEIGRYPRESECREWLRNNDRYDLDWIALDDRPWWFRPFCQHLIICQHSIGFDAEVEAKLRERLVHVGR